MTTPVFSDRMMRGQSFVRKSIGDYLEQYVPIYIDTLRDQNPDLNENMLPYPKQYLCSDPYDTTSHEYPIVGTYFTNDLDYSSLNYVVGNGSVEYDITYEAVIFVTVKTPYLGQDADNVPMYGTRADTINLRDDLVNAVRASILGRPSFGTSLQPNRIVADISSMRGTYPEPMKAGAQAGARWLCSGLINLSLTVTERVATTIIGTVEEVNLDMDTLPFE